jgi:hypothetical protein
MAEYIEREAILEIIRDKWFYNSGKTFQALLSLPVADVVEVRHGRWINCGKDDNGMTIVQCSNCQIKRYGTPAYCSRCGAKMDGGK